MFQKYEHKMFMDFPSLNMSHPAIFGWSFPLAPRRVSSLRFSSCGRYLAAGSWDQEARGKPWENHGKTMVYAYKSGTYVKSFMKSGWWWFIIESVDGEKWIMNIHGGTLR